MERASSTGRNAVLIQEILALVRVTQPSALGVTAVSGSHEALYLAAVEAFGAWDVALAQALKTLMAQQTAPSWAAGYVVERRPPRPRQTRSDALRPVVALTSNGHIVKVSGEALFSSETTRHPRAIKGWEEGLERAERLLDVGTVEAVLAVATDGRAFGWDARLLPINGQGAAGRRLGEHVGVSRWVTVLDRKDLTQRMVFVHASARGKLKVSYTSSFPDRVGAEGIPTFELEEGDTAVGAWLAERNDKLLLASSLGNAITLDLGAVRTLGLKNIGVRAMQVRDGAEVVGGMLSNHSLEVAMITRQGYGKRVLTDEFKVQARGGVGLIATRLGQNDTLVGVVACDPSTDLGVLTDAGRVLRIPAPLVPVMARTTQGERVVELEAGEAVIGLAKLLPAALGSPTANVFEM